MIERFPPKAAAVPVLERNPDITPIITMFQTMPHPHSNVVLEEYGSVRACDMILNDELDFDANNVRPNIVMQGSQLYTIINFIRKGNCGCFLYESIMAGLPKFKAIPLVPPLKTDIGIQNNMKLVFMLS